MQLGELFFSLGFKNTGSNEQKSFEKGIESSQQVVTVMAGAIEQMIFLMEEMAVKMGAISRGDLQSFKDLQKEEKCIKSIVSTEKEEIKQKDKKRGLLGVIHNKLSETFGTMNAVRLETMAMAGALTYFAKKASDAVVHMDKLASSTGLSMDTMQRLGDMAAQTGGSVNDIAGAIAHFQKESIDISLGKGGNIGAYNLLGLNPHDDPMALIDKIGHKLKAMPAAYGTALAKDIGLSEDMIYMLRNMESIKPPREETLLTEKEISRLKNFNFYFNRVFEQGKRVLQKFASFMMPVVNSIVYFFDRVGMLAGSAMNAMEPYMAKIEKYMGPLKVLGITLFAAIFPATAAFMLLALVLEDVASYVHGDKSVFGDMINYLKDTRTFADDATAAIKALIAVMTFGLVDNDKIDKFVENFKTNAGFALMSSEDIRKASMMLPVGNEAPTVQDVYNKHLELARQQAGAITHGNNKDAVTQVEQNITINGDATASAIQMIKAAGRGYNNLPIPEAGRKTPLPTGAK